YKAIVARFATSHGLTQVNSVCVQTGARPDDRKLESDLIFTTIDQVLSSFLTIPYSLSNRQANLNAGAIISSYLVFDEFHLFPVDEHGNGALATTLAMLQFLKGMTPFVLMTATFSEAMLRRLCALLDAEPVVLTQEEIDAIPSQQGKQRRYRYLADELTSNAIMSDFVQHSRKRVVVVCNTVDRAQALAQALRSEAGGLNLHIELLHSRFYTGDRNQKEEHIRREFGADKQAYQWGPTILVATQVIEVGLNITCEVLHTEMAPAAAIIQRAGRCARFAGEAGEVRVYDVPRREDGSFNFAPYLDPKPGKHASDLEVEGQSKLCERTQTAFAQLPPDGAVLNYHAELDLVNMAHEPFDLRLLDRLETNRHNLREAIEAVLKQQDRTSGRDLIRDIDSRTVIVHPNPTPETVPNPYRYEGIGVRRNALLGWYSGVQAIAMELELDWVVKLAVSARASATESSEAPEQRQRLETTGLRLARARSLRIFVGRAATSRVAA
ncbi:MAG: CRISPR-associated helicase Cas3', partial [Chloroflexia bacterium]|nr:CRISPR-associated helicase Cas3' [Chloroflexia bacterium]